ncbi:hypothetical protein BpHYR1_027757 [Brachionus plicatilis]|uniref:Uncharacterized protein n=1 Tax=Brachionus plicatilis TaxID=10195 RepID=A0A3M7SV77_BRAPC|nr:hypothetical protein BpHYR1_027757 [Brachionus plicatilis]
MFKSHKLQYLYPNLKLQIFLLIFTVTTARLACGGDLLGPMVGPRTYVTYCSSLHITHRKVLKKEILFLVQNKIS